MSDPIIESLRSGRYEMAEARALPRLIRAGERVVEVGAGIGFLTALIARHTGAELVVAIEANPLLQAYMAELHQLNGVEPVRRQALVTPQPALGPETLHVHQDLWASSPGWIKRRDQLDAVEVPVLSLAEIAETWRPTLLIVDVEPFAAWTAAEGPPHALAGADFRPFPRVLLELKPNRFTAPQIETVFDHFSSQGFAPDPAASPGPLVLFEQLAARP